MAKKVLQISTDLLVAKESALGTSVTELVTEILTKSGFNVLGCEVTQDMTETYKKQYPELLRLKTGEEVTQIMEDEIVFHRFSDAEALKKSISEKIGIKVSLEQELVTDEECEEIGCDYPLDGSFGQNIFGFDYADFTINYLKDNNGHLIVTGFLWN